jgi:hypothetical protein
MNIEADKRLEWLESLEMPEPDLSAAREEYANMIELAWHLVGRAVEWFNLEGWEPQWWADLPLIEREMKVKTSRRAKKWFLFKPDFVMFNRKTGMRAVWDLKVRQSMGSFTTYEKAEFDLQAAMYQKGLMDNGIHVDAHGLLEVLAKVPEPPKLTQKGELSKAIDQWCTAEDYRRAIAEGGRSLEDYSYTLSILEKRKFIEGILVPRSEEELKGIWRSVVRPVLTRVSHQRNFGSFECQRCWARDFCLAEMRGYEADTLIEEATNGTNQ